MKHLKVLLRVAIFNNPDLSEHELANKMFPNCSKNSAIQKLRNRIEGKTESFTESDVLIICNYLNIEPNKLFGYELQD